MKKFFFSLSVVLTLAGCSVVLKSTAPVDTIYALRPVTESAAQTDTGPARVVEIAKVSVPPGFETDRIALYLDGGRTLDYYSGAKWPDTLDIVAQDFTRRTASAVLPYVVTALPDRLSGANYRLEIKLNEFQPVYDGSADGAPRLIADADFTLIALPGERIVKSFRLSKDSVSASPRLQDITSGLEALLQQIETEAFQRMDAQLRGPSRS